MSLLFALKGTQGDKGDEGDEGDKGDKGDKGDTGEAGFFTSRCSVCLSAPQSIPNLTYTNLLFDRALYDNDGEFDLVTNHRFVTKVAGVYHISAQLFYQSLNAGTILYALIGKNGLGVKKGRVVHYVGVDEFVPVSGDVVLAVDDYIELTAYHDNGDARNVTSDDGATFMDIHQIG